MSDSHPVEYPELRSFVEERLGLYSSFCGEFDNRTAVPDLIRTWRSTISQKSMAQAFQDVVRDQLGYPDKRCRVLYGHDFSPIGDIGLSVIFEQMLTELRQDEWTDFWVYTPQYSVALGVRAVLESVGLGNQLAYGFKYNLDEFAEWFTDFDEFSQAMHRNSHIIVQNLPIFINRIHKPNPNLSPGL